MFCSHRPLPIPGWNETGSSLLSIMQALSPFGLVQRPHCFNMPKYVSTYLSRHALSESVIYKDHGPSVAICPSWNYLVPHHICCSTSKYCMVYL